MMYFMVAMMLMVGRMIMVMVVMVVVVVVCWGWYANAHASVADAYNARA